MSKYASRLLVVMLFVGAVQAQVAVPENPGFTPEQAAAMAARSRNSKSSDILYPKNLTPPVETRATVRIDGKSGGRRWGGVGSAPSNVMGRMLQFYPQAIQQDILDLFFKPNFGMALTHLKVEVGGDNNSTSGTEPSFAHTREEMAKPDFHRGYIYQLMRDARTRNPAIELGALAWTQPYWVGNGTGRTDNKSFFTQESADYFVKFYEGARKEWGLEMEYFSPEQNERDPSGRRDWVVKTLRPAFDKAGFENVKFILDHDGWPLRKEDDDPELLKLISARGRHYVENDPRKITPREAQESGVPLWNAEGWSRIGQNWPLAIYLAESVARCYVDSKITQFTTWPLQAGGLAGCLYSTTGLMMANKPWSGYYEIYPTLWIVAHFNQFAPMGWKTVDGGCGGLFVEHNAVYDRATIGEAGIKGEWVRARLNYLTLASPDGKDYSIIVVNTSPFARTLDFEVTNLPGKPLHQWVSTEQEQFVHTGLVNVTGQKITLTIQPWSVVSLTTTTGQQKGQPKNPIPQDSILALPFRDDFESYRVGADPRYSHCVAGYFEVYQAPGESKTYRQMVPAKGLTWAIPKDNYPCVAIGDIRWNDYEVSSDAGLEGNGTVALWSRVTSFRDHGLGGYYLRLDQDGQWELGVSKTGGGPDARTYSEKTLSSGQVTGFNAAAWHKLTILADGSLLRASIDGKPVTEIKDNTYSNGAVGYSTWADGIQRDYFDMKKAMVIGLKYGQARFDNLLVRSVPGKLLQAGWKATATSEHAGNEAAKAIDGNPRTFWHSEYNSKGPLPQSLTVDLGQRHLLREVRVLQRQDGGHSYITRYVLYLSADGQSFTKVSEGQWEDDATMKVVAFPPKSARYVRVEALEASGQRNCNVSVAEMQVIEAEEPSGGFPAPKDSTGAVTVREQGRPGDFPLVTGGRAAPVWVDGADFKVARIAAELFAGDVERVSGVKPALIAGEGSEVVLIGTLGHSALIDRLVKEKKLDVSAIQKKWESHLIATLAGPLPGVKSALVIAGSDRRGTAYGVFTLSEAMGVSPWYWWADVTPAHRAQLFVAGGTYRQGPPSVKYRGIFINDEFAGLHPWASKTFEKDRKHIGPKTYAKIFELLLRLKANFCWPAMWGGARYFNVYPENKLVADDYAIVMGSSHCEPLLFNNMENAEWDEKTDGPWNFLTNREKIEAAWTKRLTENGKFENVYTLGLRGIHDRPIQGGTNVAEKAAILQKAIDAQRGLLARLVNPDVAAVPQVFCPYREVLDLYKAGVKVPDDVTLIWADDNYGHIRQVSTPEEQKRSGRAGVYYHLSFFLNTWLCPYSPTLIAYEMTKAHEYGADRLWVFNIGDIKPAEKELTFAMQLAWDVHRWTPQTADRFVEEWARETFGAECAGDIAEIMRGYYRLAARGLPEFLNRGGNCLPKYSLKEMNERIAAYRELARQTEAVGQRIPARLQDAYFQLVHYPVLGAGLINERVFLALQSLDLAARGDGAALDLAARSVKAAEMVTKITNDYNHQIAGGKWNHMMDGAPREVPAVATPELVAKGKAGKAAAAAKITEPDPVLTVLARSFVRKHDRPDATMTVLPGLGYANGVAVFPFTAPSIKTNQVTEAAWVEYELDLPAGALRLDIRALPTERFHDGRGLAYAVSLNDGQPKVFDVHAGEGEGIWWENVKRGFNFRSVNYTANLPRKLKLRIYLLDPGLVLQDIAVYSTTKGTAVHK